MSNLFPLMAAAGNVTTGADTDADFENTVLLINGDGAADGGQNNTFLDTSGNGHAITRNGNVTQGSFSPFAKDDGKWGNYFDGTGQNLSFADDATFELGSGDFTIECWVYLEAYSGENGEGFITKWSAGQLAYYLGTTNSTNTHELTFAWTTNGSTIQKIESNYVPPLNEWHHYAVSRNSNEVRLYVDGVLKGSNLSFTDTIYSGSSPVAIAINNGFSSTWDVNGYISNARIVKGTGLYSTAFTPPTTPLTAVSGTSLLTCQSNRFVDNSSNAHSITVTGTPKVTTFSPFPETTAYTRSTVNQGAMEFDGSGDYLTVPNNTDLILGTGDCTIECWVYPLAVNASNANPILNKLNGASNNGWLLGMSNTGLWQFSTGSNVIVRAGTVVLNTWTHLAAVRESGTTTLYVNGVSVGTTASVFDFTDTVDLFVGFNSSFVAVNAYVSNARIIKGTAVYTADFTVPTEPLTAITNTSLLTCQAAGAVDNSSNAHTITVNGDAKQSVFVPFGERSVEFDGVDDYLSVSNSGGEFSVTSSFSVEAWFYMTEAPTNGTTGAHCIISHWDGSSDPRAWFIDTSNNLDFRVFVYDSGGSAVVSQTGVGSFSLNQWTHVALTWDGSSYRFFVDGSLIFTTSSSTAPNPATSKNVIIGHNTNTHYFPGYISNVRITVDNGAQYTADFAPPTEPLTAITGTQLLTCQNSVFQDNSGNAHAITVNGNPQASNNLPFGERSVYFDGTGDYLNTSSGSGAFEFSGDFTIEAWVQTSVYSTDTAWRRIWSNGADSSTSIQLLFPNASSLAVRSNSNLITGSTVVADGSWHHVAVTREGSSLKLFVDGTQDGSTVTTSQVFNYSDTFVIGRYYSGNGHFNGNISNARVVKGTAVYTADFTVPTEPLTAITNTSLLTCQDAVFQDNSGNAHAITVNGNAEASTNIPFAPTITYGVQQYLDDAYTVANRGGSGYFDGTGDYLSVPNSSDFTMGDGDFTLEAWIYPTASGTNGAIFDYSSSTTATSAFDLRTAGTTARIYVRIGGSVYNASNNNATLHQWHHIAAVRNGTSLKVYIDGKGGTSTTISGSLNSTSDPLSIGEIAGTYYYPGYISDARIIKGTALYTSDFEPPTAPLAPVSGTSLLCNFTNASIIDRTGSNVLETVGNAQVDTTTFKYGTGSLEFDGTGDYLVTTSNEAFNFGTTEDFTIECWAQYDGTSNTGIWQTSSTPGPEGSQQLGLVWYQDKIYSIIKASGTNTGSPTVSANTWYHLAVVRYNGTTNVYLDGTSIKSVSDTYNYTGRPYFVIGGYSTTSYLMNGYIDDFRITKGIARYTANFTPPTKALPVIGV